jgi:hypothetical protein
MQQTPQQQALNAANQVQSLMAQLRALQNQVNAFLLTYNDQSYASIWAGLPTVAINATTGLPSAYDLTAGSGTVTATQASTVLSFSTSQSNLAGTYIAITGDTSNGLYLVGSGSGTAWTIATPFGGSNLSGAAWGTSNPNSAHPIALPVGSPILMAEGNLITAIGALQNFQSYMTGVAISTQVNTPQKFADILNS